jgi:hypothetical protein
MPTGHFVPVLITFLDRVAAAWNAAAAYHLKSVLQSETLGLGPADFALALTAFILLTAWKAQPWIVVVFAAAGGVALTGLTAP